MISTITEYLSLDPIVRTPRDEQSSEQRKPMWIHRFTATYL